jgi:hypothetical protein
MRMMLALLPLIPQLLVLSHASAQERGPWTTTLSVNRKALAVGECSAVALDLKNAKSEWPRGPNGQLVSMSDFDLSVSAPAARAVVGKYDGANSFAVCACPKAPAGTVATVIATYPSKWIAPKVREPGVSFTTTTSVPIVAGVSSGNPPGCDAPTPTTAAAGGQAPWTVTVQALDPLPIGTCGAVSLTLRDSTGKDWPRGPLGNRVSTTDFDFAVSTANGQDAVGKRDAASFLACGCQSGKVGETGTVTASYPAHGLASKSQVPGVALQAVAPFTLSAARGSWNPVGCDGKQQQVASTVGAPITTIAPVAATPGPAPAAPVYTAQAPHGAVEPPSGIAATPVVAIPAAPSAPVLTRGSSPIAAPPLAPPRAPAGTPAPPPLQNPTGFTAVDRGGGGVDWQWQAVPGAVKYRLDGTGLPATGYFSTTTHNAFPHVPGGPGSWRVTSVFPGNVADTASGTRVSLVVHVLPARSMKYLTKNNGAGSLAQVQIPANPFDPEHPCTPSIAHQTPNDCTQYDLDHHTVNQGVFPGDLSTALYDPAALTWLTETSVDNWVKTGLRRWLDVTLPLWGDQTQAANEAVYGNPLDLGVGRRAACAQEMKGPPHPGLKTVCYATAHGAIPGTPGFNDPATITHPAPGQGGDFILSMIIVKDPTGTTFLVWSGANTLSPTVKLDTEGPKYVPFACISCHGGTYNASTRKVDGASFLPLDPNLLSFASPADQAAQEEKIRKINFMIHNAQPQSAIASYLAGLYHGAIATAGTTAQPDYVPASWSEQAGFYRSVVRPHCAMCHLAAPPSWNFASWSNFQQNAPLIHADVCLAHTMPHAEVPFKSFWLKDTGILYLPGLLASTLGFPSC